MTTSPTTPPPGMIETPEKRVARLAALLSGAALTLENILESKHDEVDWDAAFDMRNALRDSGFLKDGGE